MIVPDLNLLLYAYDSASPFHAQAVLWWEQSVSGVDPVGLPKVVIFGFLRIATNPRAFQHPMSAAEAIGHIRSWTAQPNVQVIESGPQHVAQVLILLERSGVAGNLTTDAQIAAIARDHAAVLHTTDADFSRFPGLQWLNPLTGGGSHSKRSAR